MTDYPRGNFGEIRLGKETTWGAPSTDEMSRMDQSTIERGTTALALMQRAGGEVARVITENYPNGRRFVVLCGSGNNGGDGLVIAQTLRGVGLDTQVVLSSAERYSPECLHQLTKQRDLLMLTSGSAPQLPIDVKTSEVSVRELELLLGESDVVVDALLGTGQRSAPRQQIAELIQCVERARGQGAHFGVVSVDIPSGVDADSGQLFSPHIKADHTVCIEAIKRGLLQFPAREVCGSVETVSIGILSDANVEFRALEGGNLPILRRRRADAHKGDFGRILVIGGSLAMPGAPALTALAALRAGAGTVSLVTKRSWSGSQILPECMREVLSRDGDSFDGEDASEVVSLLGGFDVLVIGPGMGLSAGSGDFLSRVCEGVRLLGKRAVFDADAINQISLLGISIQGIDAVVTPHPGEASRMLGRPTPTVQANRFNSVSELWRKYGVVSVLKGAGTLVYGAPGGRIVCRGTPYLATAGSGDVLAGIIGALCARCDSSFEAACLGAWSHAVAGVLASQESGGPILASDITRAASRVIGGLEA